MNLKSSITLFSHHVIIPLIIGSMLYISYRSLSLRMFSWFEAIGLSNFIKSIREIINPYKESLPNWIYFSMPDALWVYSFTSAILLIWNNKIVKAKYWLLIPFISGCLVEIAQGLKLVEGTFDPIDLILCSLSFILSMIIINSISVKHENNTHQNY